jgi:pimeloyl-ACP methyl ester carboxylesterase
MRDEASQSVVVEGGRSLRFAEWGSPSGRPVFHLHGTPGCRLPTRRRIEQDLEGILRSLDVRVIAYDRPGYGGSARHAGRAVADAAGDVLAIADALGFDGIAVEGISGGAPHALALAALAPDRVRRAACIAPMGPYEQMGSALWSQNQDRAVQEYLSWCVEGEARILVEFAREDAEQRAETTAGDPLDASVFEQTRNGLFGWVDDELAFLRPWGFDLATIVTPMHLWYDPTETILPRQHAEWLAGRIKGAKLVPTNALGHGSPGDPRPDWERVYSWLAG